MTNYRALSFSPLTAASLLTLAGCLLMAAPAAAQTECQPDDLFCAELRIGGGGAGVRIGPGQRPAPPPVQVEVQPAPPRPPVVVVQPEPVPQPPVVVVQPQPQPRPQYVEVQPQYQQQYVEQEYYEVRQPRQRRQRPEVAQSPIGLHIHIDGIGGEDLGLFGAGAALRLRPSPYFAVDLGAGIVGGVDYNGLDHVEVPITATARIFFNPYNRFQLYALLGVGGSWSHAEGANQHTGAYVNRDYGHLIGSLGIGAEWRLSSVFALNLDVRGFLRGRVDESGEPEFTELTDAGWQSTDLSGGAAAQLGMTFYFGR